MSSNSSKKMSVGTWAPNRSEYTERMTVTPPLAARMLDFNSRNRPVSSKKVTRLAEKMRSGNWVWTHQGVGFDTDGRLVDGQHRLMAVVASDTSQDLLVTYGMSPDAFDHVDTEGSRNSADLLAIRVPGIKHRKALCAISRASMRGIVNPNGQTTAATVAEFAEWYREQITPIYEAIRPQSAWARKAPLMAAFFNAVRGVDEWPGGHGGRDYDTVLLLAMRYGEMEWDGATDPLKSLFKRISRANSTVGTELSELELYSMTVAAVRLILRNKTSSRSQKSDIEWGAKSDTGQKPRAVPVTGKNRSAKLASVSGGKAPSRPRTMVRKRGGGGK